MTTWKRFLVWSHAEVSSFLNRKKQQQQKEQKQTKKQTSSRERFYFKYECVQMEERMRSKQSWLHLFPITTYACISLTIWKQGITGEAVVAQACNPSYMNTLELLHDYYLWTGAFLNTE